MFKFELKRGSLTQRVGEGLTLSDLAVKGGLNGSTEWFNSSPLQTLPCGSGQGRMRTKTKAVRKGWDHSAGVIRDAFAYPT